MRRFHAALRFDVEKQTQQARLSYILIWSTMLVITVFQLVEVLLSPENLLRSIVIILAVDISGIAFIVLNRRGHTQLASSLFIAVLSFLVTALALTSGGVHSPAVAYYFLIVLIASLLLGERASIVTGVVFSITGLAMVLIEYAGILPVQTINRTLVSLLIEDVMFIAILISLQHLASKSIKETLRQAQLELKERKRREDQLKSLTERFQLATKAAAMGVWDWDLQTNQIVWDDRQFAIYGLPPAPNGLISYETWAERIHPEDLRILEASLQNEIVDRELVTHEFRILRPDGELRYVRSEEAVVADDQGKPARRVGINMDITERKEAERERLQLVHDLEKRVNELIVMHHTARMTQVEQPFIREFLTEIVVLIPPSWQYPEVCEARIAYGDIEVATPGWRETPWKQSISFETADGKGVIEVVYLVEKPIREEGPFLAEERMMLVSLAEMLGAYFTHQPTIEALRQREIEFRAIFENAGIGIALLDTEGHPAKCNPALEKFLGYTQEELSQMTFPEFTHPEDVETDVSLYRSLMAGERDNYQIEKRYIRKDGVIVWGRLTVSLIRKSGNGVQYAIGMVEDITDRKAGEESIQGLYQQARRHLQHVQATHDIDKTIASSMDLRLTLDVVLEQAIAQLGVDAASVLLIDPKSYTLEFKAGRGFLGEGIENTRLRLGEGFAGRAALERRMMIEPDLSKDVENSRFSQLLANEHFVFYCGTPLVAKGQVKGVLEVFQRSPRIADPEWLDFLTTLAEQTAIAIDSSTLFEELQRSNSNLAAAYETTIEGWSRALDLRDKETEGHSKRVTEMTMQLGRVLGLSDEEILNVRHGALLHDIGKMGVPDHILLKPGSLTDEEWEIMKRHPVYAYDLLYPIKQLHSALDIAYCHHENWDGSGYPRGLKGTQIPLAARIFAVVDVWDALRSDRPYRKGWPDDKALEHIRSLSGKQFDPQVVEAFLELIQNHRKG
jgi:PAS domain S-box-containing protein